MSPHTLGMMKKTIPLFFGLIMEDDFTELSREILRQEIPSNDPQLLSEIFHLSIRNNTAQRISHHLLNTFEPELLPFIRGDHGEDFLFATIQSSDVSIMKKLIKKGCTGREPYEKYLSGLSKAQLHDIKMIDLGKKRNLTGIIRLLDQGVDMKKSFEQLGGKCVFNFILESEYFDFFKILIEKYSLLECFGSIEAKAQLKILTLLENNYNLEALEYFKNSFPKNNSICTKFRSLGKNTHFYQYAVLYNSILLQNGDCIEKMVDFIFLGEKHNNLTVKDLQKALFVACERGKFRSLIYLIGRVDFYFGVRNEKNETFEDVARKNGFYRCANYLNACKKLQTNLKRS